MYFDRRQLNICPLKYPSVSYIRYREALRLPFKTLKKTKGIHYVRVVHIYIYEPSDPASLALGLPCLPQPRSGRQCTVHPVPRHPGALIGPLVSKVKRARISVCPPARDLCVCMGVCMCVCACMHTCVFWIHQLSLLCMTNISHCSLPIQVLLWVSSVAVSQIYCKIAPFLREGVLEETGRVACVAFSWNLWSQWKTWHLPLNEETWKLQALCNVLSCIHWGKVSMRSK